MLKYRVIKDGRVTNEWTSNFAGADYYEPCFGKPERWVSEMELQREGKTEADAIETRKTEIMGETVWSYKLPAEFRVEVIDLTLDERWVEEQENRKREEGYAAVGATDRALLIALWERVVEGRPQASDALQAKRAQVKADTPKTPRAK